MDDRTARHSVDRIPARSLRILVYVLKFFYCQTITEANCRRPSVRHKAQFGTIDSLQKKWFKTSIRKIFVYFFFN